MTRGPPGAPRRPHDTEEGRSRRSPAPCGPARRTDRGCVAAAAIKHGGAPHDGRAARPHATRRPPSLREPRPRPPILGFGLSVGFRISAGFSFGHGFSPELEFVAGSGFKSGFSFECPDTPLELNLTRCHRYSVHNMLTRGTYKFVSN